MLMRSRTLRKNSYIVVLVLQWVAGVLSAIIGGLSSTQPDDFGSAATYLKPFVGWSIHHRWLAPILTITIAGGQLSKREIGNPWVWEAIKDTLNRMQEHAFKDRNQEGPHLNRVTLFRHVAWHMCFKKSVRSRFRLRKPWGDWLVPVERSGHLTQKTNVAFRASDDPNEAEGVAGQTWVRDGVVFVDQLPDVSGSCSDAAISEYARKSWVSEEWLRVEQSTARALLGIPVKVRGEIWGVVVVDSRSPSIENTEVIIESYRVIAKILGKLLERA